MQGEKSFLLILIIGLAVGSFLTAVLGYFILPDYKMTPMSPEESNVVRWCYLLVGISSSVMAAVSLLIWLIAAFKAGIFARPPIAEIVIATAIVILWTMMIMDTAWHAFMRLHSVTFF